MRETRGWGKEVDRLVWSAKCADVLLIARIMHERLWFVVPASAGLFLLGFR
ncbi:hypothetical protein FJY63_14430 [Candidatus Sumerlaeota bacterium]|nr:hypothetical protein [Candidatus Sumerlaeota bacterium]